MLNYYFILFYALYWRKYYYFYVHVSCRRRQRHQPEEKCGRERERVYCSVFQVVSTVSRRVWFGRQPTQICETCRHALGILPFSIQCRMLQKTNRNYTHMHKHQAPSTIIIIIIMLLICRYVMNEWVEKKIYSAKIVSTTDIKMKKNWRSRESHRLQVVQRN